MTKIAIYTRVSKADGSQDVERQVTELREFAKKEEWQIVEEITESISGTKTNREGIKKIINLARANRIQKVLIHEVSRLGRNLADAVNTVEELKRCKVSVFSFKERQETLDANFEYTFYGNIIFSLMAGFAAQERQTISFRIKSGLKLAKQKGKKFGRPPKEKIKGEDEVIKLYEQGHIYDAFGNKQKASYDRIVKCLGGKVSKRTVVSIVKKYRAENEKNNLIIKENQD